MKCDESVRFLEPHNGCFTSYWPSNNGWLRTSLQSLREHSEIPLGARTRAFLLDGRFREQLFSSFSPRAALLVLGRVHSLGITTDCVLSAGVPQTHLDELLKQDGRLESPLLFRWFESKSPFLAERYSFLGMGPTPRWRATCAAFGVEKIVIDGVINFDTGRALVVKLYDPARKNGGGGVAHDLHEFLRSQQALDETAVRESALHQTASVPLAPQPRLTAKELEVLRWIRLGKTNVEIGMILNNSPATVKTHVQRMLHKVGAGNRGALATLVQQATRDQASSTVVASQSNA
jgi:DNA-binding CsgD family transcriptional regulator